MFLISAFFKADLHLFDAISDFTQFLIYITIDCMVASALNDSSHRFMNPVDVVSLTIRKYLNETRGFFVVSVPFKL